MNEMILTKQHLTAFAAYLGREEKSRATIEKYLRDASAFRAWTAGRPVTKELVVAYKHRLVDLGYTITYDLSNGWVKKDGYYYWRSVVASKGNTGELLTCQLNKDATPPDGYTLSVEILAQSIQAMPEYVVEEVWGVTVNSDGTLNIQ